MLNGANLGAEDASAPYSVSWNTTTVTNGAYTLTSVARDAAGNQATSTAVSVTVTNAVTDTAAPTISLSAPANGASISGMVTVSATAADNVGVVGVQFMLNGANLGAEDTTAPYSISWNTAAVSAGTYLLMGVARDAAGNQTTSAAVSVTVVNSEDTIPPAIWLSAPTTGLTMSGNIVVAAIASDNVAVAGVQFTANSTNLGEEDTVEPYSIFWDTTAVPDGVYTLTAVARDAAGNQTSSVVTIIINNGNSPAPPYTQISFSVPAEGGQTWITSNTSASITTEHARLQDDSAPSDLSGLALISFRKDGILVSESALPAIAPMSSGRVYAEMNGPTNVGIAFTNPNSQTASISFYFTNDGGDFGHGAFTLAPSNHKSAFLNEAPFNGPVPMLGTLTFSSSVPVGVIAVHNYTNERGEFLMTALPVSDITQSSTNAVVLPHFVDGGGWTTQLVLTNPSDSVLAGSIVFYGPGADGQSPPALTMTLNGTTASGFQYFIRPRSAMRLVTANTEPALRVGSVQIIPDAGQPAAPTSAALFFFERNEVIVSEAGVAGMPAGTAFRTYAEAAGSDNEAGFVETGLAIANPSTIPAVVTLELKTMGGQPVGLPVMFTLPGNGQVAKFISHLFPTLVKPFRGFLRVTSTAPVSVTSLLCRYNERLDFLFTTTPPRNELEAASGSQLVFPHIASGGGFATQLVIFGNGTADTGRLMLSSPTGTTPVMTNLQPFN
jgi:hypothetical protein